MKQNIEIYLADSTPCTRVGLTDFLILEEFGHSDRNGGLLRKKRKNSAKIGMFGNYGIRVAVCLPMFFPNKTNINTLLLRLNFCFFTNVFATMTKGIKLIYLTFNKMIAAQSIVIFRFV